MNVADAVTALGAGGLFSSGFSLVELLLAGIMGLFLAGSLALCVMTFRAASAARRARGEAQEALAAIEAQAAAFKALSAGLERAGADLAASQAELKDLQVTTRQALEAQAALGAQPAATAPQAVERWLDPLPPGGNEPGTVTQPRLRETEPQELPAKSSLLRGLLRRR